MANIQYYDVILKPVVTEKSMELMADKKYTFLVHTEATKSQIKEAVEKMFNGTKVKSVNTMNLDGKNKRRGMTFGKTAKTKKAVVALTEDSADIASYLSEDTDMLAAEAAYCELEQELQYELDHYETLHPGYDEYRFDLDEIEHDPYVLISILTAFHEGVFTIDEVQAELQMLFEKQYILTQTVEVEVRYRTETRTDSEGNDYDVEVPYNYYICNVKLENFNLSHVPVYIMDEETLSLYAVYMATLGNREDLFPGSGYVDKYTKPPTTYDIPSSALEDETFAALITEAEKYIGYPYVWGGSNPNTSFDCSGFVSWVLTQSGVCNTGRLGAQGLYNISTPVSSANARPGDLIFFVGTYDTPGVSHVGIYVGGGKMLHCGDPIQYADINTSYWQSHFYAFGRPPYN